MPRRLRRVGSDLLEYLRITGWGVWVVIAVALNVLDLAQLFPKVQWLQQIPDWLPRALGFTALLVGPFLAFRRVRRGLEEAERERRRWQDDFQRAFAEFKLETLHGDLSRLSTQKRLEAVEPVYRQRRDEILRGDFSRAPEAIPAAKAYMDLVSRIVPQGSVAWGHAQAEVQDLCERVESRLLERYQV